MVCSAVWCAALDLQWHDHCARTVTGQAGSATPLHRPWAAVVLLAQDGERDVTAHCSRHIW